MRGGILAPTKAQREKYADWLLVHRSLRATVPARMQALAKEYEVMVMFLLNIH
jgi:hypothetical protein